MKFKWFIKNQHFPVWLFLKKAYLVKKSVKRSFHDTELKSNIKHKVGLYIKLGFAHNVNNQK